MEEQNVCRAVHERRVMFDEDKEIKGARSCGAFQAVLKALFCVLR